MNSGKRNRPGETALRVVKPARELLRIAILGGSHADRAGFFALFCERAGVFAGKDLDAAKAAYGEAGDGWRRLLDGQPALRRDCVPVHSERRDFAVFGSASPDALIEGIVAGDTQIDAAILVVDERAGLGRSVRRQAGLVAMLGITHCCVAIVARTAAGFRHRTFASAADEITAGLRTAIPHIHHIVPVALDGGAMIAERPRAMAWFTGATLVEALNELPPARPLQDQPLRLPVQGSTKVDGSWLFHGTIEQGAVGPGDELVFSPSNKTATLKTLEKAADGARGEPLERAVAGQSVRWTLEQNIFAEREDVAAHPGDLPVETEVFAARLLWSCDEPLSVGRRFRLKTGATEAGVVVESVARVIDPASLNTKRDGLLTRGQLGHAVLRARRMLAIDSFSASGPAGRFVLLDEESVVAGGIISMEGYADQRALNTRRATNITRFEQGVTRSARAKVNGHSGGVLWFTGLSGAGKSTLAVGLERRLHKRGYQVFVLDGDNIRHGLNANLGFSPEDRAENVRRVGEVAALFSNAGIITISAFISPYRSDRRRAREAAGTSFHEVHVKADLATCERRDPKGLYKKARAGEIADFTGVSAPYEAPGNADLVVDTAKYSVDECLDQLVAYVDEKFPL